jgi:hypothetical protein
MFSAQVRSGSQQGFMRRAFHGYASLDIRIRSFKPRRQARRPQPRWSDVSGGCRIRPIHATIVKEAAD